MAEKLTVDERMGIMWRLVYHLREDGVQFYSNPLPDLYAFCDAEFSQDLISGVIKNHRQRNG